MLTTLQPLQWRWCRLLMAVNYAVGPLNLILAIRLILQILFKNEPASKARPGAPRAHRNQRIQYQGEPTAAAIHIRPTVA
jgi:hypothetical protein